MGWLLLYAEYGRSRRRCWAAGDKQDWRQAQHVLLLNCNGNPHAIAPFYRFKKAVEKGEIDEQEQKRAHARQSLERYMHYWQRWAENDSSRKKVGSVCCCSPPRCCCCCMVGCLARAGLVAGAGGGCDQLHKLRGLAIVCHCRVVAVLTVSQCVVTSLAPCAGAAAGAPVRGDAIVSHCRSLCFAPLSPGLQALQQVDKFRGEQQEILSERTATPTSQLKFIVDAWMQVGASRLLFVCLFGFASAAAWWTVLRGRVHAGAGLLE